MARGACGPAGVVEPGKEAIGVSQELGRSCRFHRLHRPGGGGRTERTPGPPSLRAWAAEAKPKTQRWYRQTKATKCGETDGRKSQRLDSTGETRERAHPDRGEGSEAPDRGTV